MFRALTIAYANACQNQLAQRSAFSAPSSLPPQTPRHKNNASAYPEGLLVPQTQASSMTLHLDASVQVIVRDGVRGGVADEQSAEGDSECRSSHVTLEPNRGRRRRNNAIDVTEQRKGGETTTTCGE